MNINIDFGRTIVVYLTFVILKLFNQITWDWIYVNIPIFIIVAVYIIGFSVYKLSKYTNWSGELNINL